MTIYNKNTCHSTYNFKQMYLVMINTLYGSDFT